MKENEFDGKKYMTFIKLFFIKILSRIKAKITSSVKSALFRIEFMRAFFRKRRNYILYQHENILDAVAGIQQAQ